MLESFISTYERLAEPVTAPIACDAVRLVGVRPDSRVIDVAAGTGSFALAAAATSASVLATDRDAGMVGRLISRLKPYADCRAEIMSCDRLEVESSSFDVACSSFGALLLPQWRAGLDELVRVTRPGGTVVVSTWVDHGGPEPMALAKRVFESRYPGTAFWGEREEEHSRWTYALLTDALRVAGCAEVSVSVSPTVCRSTSVSELLTAFILGLNKCFNKSSLLLSPLSRFANLGCQAYRKAHLVQM